MVLSAVTVLLILTAILSLSCGSVSIPLQEFWRALTGEAGYGTERVIILGLRLPRLIGAVLAGTGLSVGGLLLQTVTGNDLASPGIIGVNAGAGAGVMLALCFAPGVYTLPPVAAFAGAVCATVLILALSGKGGSKSSLILAGVAVSSLLSALISFLSLLYPDMLVSYTAFSAGSLNGVFMRDLTLPAVIIIASLCAALALCPALNLLCLGDEIAASLGVRVRALRTASVLICCAACAGAVSFAGLLGFVGLIVPHAAKALFGEDLRKALPTTAIMGALLVCSADLAGRTVFAPTQLPVGIITAFLGAPFFLYLIMRRRGL